MITMGVTNSRLRQSESRAITRIAVAGFKSIDAEQSIEIAPLTILTGANSAGKSSIMQPLLLLKQTLEAQFDTGALYLSGVNARFTETKQLFYKSRDKFSISLTFDNSAQIALHFIRKKGEHNLQIEFMDTVTSHETFKIRHTMTDAEMLAFISASIGSERRKRLSADLETLVKPLMQVRQNRSFLEVISPLGTFPPPVHQKSIQSILHVPGLRGNPQRTYPYTAVGETFPGTFDVYTASVIAYWQEKGKSEELSAIGNQLARLGLTWKVASKRQSDTSIELTVGRTLKAKRGGADMVSIADVGFGVSQTLPVLVALLTAKPGQMVYIEQPEIHLHPRAQVAMADILADAAKRGVRVVIETHSSLLLTAVQTLIAQGSLSPELVRLHWFNRDEEGVTTIQSVTPDDTGAYGAWPIDFGDVEMDAQQHYLDAAESRLMEETNV
jgi:predicted ATPase